MNSTARCLRVQIGIVFCLAIFLISLFPKDVYADASANSEGSDWWGDNSGWDWNWPGIARKPGGNVVGQYKHWFETAEPANWVGHGPAMWTLPANINDYPYWPFMLVGNTGGNGAFTTDVHTDVATSDWQWKAYRNNLLPSEIVFRKGTIAYANAKSIPHVLTEAHSRSKLIDPWEFANPVPGENWSILGQIAPSGSLSVSEDYNELASAFFEMSYALSVDNGDPLDVLRLHVGVDGEHPDVSLTYAPNAHFFRDNVEIYASQIIAELESYYSADYNKWLLSPSDDNGYYFDVAFNLISTTSYATLYSAPTSGANDIRAVPEPSTLILVIAGLLGSILVMRKRGE